MKAGEVIANGRTSVVRAYGTGSVIKTLRHGVPDHWVDVEAHLTESVRCLDVPAPEVRDVVVFDGRPSIVFERIDGPSMWQTMVAEPDEIEPLVEVLADVQHQILCAGLPDGVPDFITRLNGKIREAEQLSEIERSEACQLAESLPRGAALLHGDLHPGNVLMGADGPRVIDWFDAAIGHPVADVVRSSILMRPVPQPTGHDAQHLPGATPELLNRLHRAYAKRFTDMLTEAGDDLARWEAVIAAGRLNEGAQSDESGLLALWAARTSHTSDLVT